MLLVLRIGIQVLLCCFLFYILHKQTLPKIWSLWRIYLINVIVIFFRLLPYEQVFIFITFNQHSVINIWHSHYFLVAWTNLELLSEGWKVLYSAWYRSIFIYIFRFTCVCFKVMKINIVLLIWINFSFLHWIVNTLRWLEFGYLLWTHIYFVVFLIKNLVWWIASNVSVSALN